MTIPKLTLVFPHLALNLIISTPALVIILLGFFVIYAIFSLVLYYHWLSYGMGNKGILAAEGLYFMVSVFLFVISALAITYY